MTVTTSIKEKIKDEVFDFFSEECDIPRDELNDDTNIITELGGDSLMLLELINGWKEDYSLDVELRVIGKYLTRNPADTLSKIVNFACLMIEKGEHFTEEG